MKTIVSVLTAGAILTGGGFVTTRAAQKSAHVLQMEKEAQWGQAPPMLPPGAQIAVLAGDPSRPAPYTIRLKFPAHYNIAAHSHPTDENVVIVSGALTFGMGEKLAKASPANKMLAAGGYALMPADMNHYAFTGAEATTIVLYGIGPVEFKYVNPSDDPRRVKSDTK
jgi:quercetin dioxygenase-like cupin family protein